MAVLVRWRRGLGAGLRAVADRLDRARDAPEGPAEERAVARAPGWVAMLGQDPSRAHRTGLAGAPEHWLARLREAGLLDGGDGGRAGGNPDGPVPAPGAEEPTGLDVAAAQRRRRAGEPGRSSDDAEDVRAADGRRRSRAEGPGGPRSSRRGRSRDNVGDTDVGGTRGADGPDSRRAADAGPGADGRAGRGADTPARRRPGERGPVARLRLPTGEPQRPGRGSARAGAGGRGSLAPSPSPSASASERGAAPADAGSTAARESSSRAARLVLPTEQGTARDAGIGARARERPAHRPESTAGAAPGAPGSTAPGGHADGAPALAAQAGPTARRGDPRARLPRTSVDSSTTDVAGPGPGAARGPIGRGDGTLDPAHPGGAVHPADAGTSFLDAVTPFWDEATPRRPRSEAVRSESLPRPGREGRSAAEHLRVLDRSVHAPDAATTGQPVDPWPTLPARAAVAPLAAGPRLEPALARAARLADEQAAV